MYEIICIQETKTDDTDILAIEEIFKEIGFYILMNNRFKLNNYRSGGLAFAYKFELHDFISILSNETCISQWFKLSTTFTGLDVNIVIGNVYIPPEGSKYSDKDNFETLTAQILDYSIDNHIIMCGDFNAHTGTLDDICNFDHNVLNTLELNDNFMNDFLNDLRDNDATINLPLRKNSDVKRINNYGKELIDLCKNLNLVVVNGRAGNDSSLGKCTTKDNSVIDYFLVNPTLFEHINEFEVHPFDRLFSDVHCKIHCELNKEYVNVPDAENIEENQNNPVNIISNGNNCFPNWNENNCDIYLRNISNEAVENILSIFDENIDSKSIIDKVTCSLKEIFLDTANDSFGRNDVKKRKFKNSRYKSHKKWFNADCINARRNYLQSKLSFNHNRSTENRLDLDESFKSYRKTVRKAKSVYYEKFNHKLRKMQKNNARDFFKLFKSRKKKKIPMNLSELKEYFEKLSSSEKQSENIQYLFVDTIECARILNSPITRKEIRACIKKLKNNRAVGQDKIRNEYIKITIDVFMPIYLKLFNLILDSGEVPHDWTLGMIIPIYKNKGAVDDCTNYRGITLLSCLGKLFTNILNDRLTYFSDSTNLIHENQAGFRASYSTMDHCLLLKLLIDYYMASKKKLFCAFIDYQKAFDKIEHCLLWKKLINSNITGKLFSVIKNLYKDIKSCVFLEGKKSDFFVSNIGVRQGENLSPFLFSLFINDIEDYFMNNDCTHLDFDSNVISDYMKLMIILYADDTVILADSAERLQHSLNILFEYCQTWSLTVNNDKTKICIFSYRKVNHSLYDFKFNNMTLEIVDEFLYLGVVFKHNGNFNLCQKRLCDQAQKAMFSILQYARKYMLETDLKIQLFDKMIKPILMYNCELWGFENLQVIERMHLKYCKYVLCLKKSTPDIMVYGELGRFPLYIEIYCRIIKYWLKLINGKSSKLVYKLFFICKNVIDANIANNRFKWLQKVKDILNQCNVLWLWHNNIIYFDKIEIEKFKNHIKFKLEAQYKIVWKNQVYQSPKCVLYRVYKTDFCEEKYLTSLNNDLCKNICKFRTSNHKLPIEVGRYINIPRHERTCTHCDSPEICDEYHVLFKCTAFNNQRRKYLPYYQDRQLQNTSVLALYNIFNNSTQNIKKLALFIKEILKVFI